MILFAKPNIWNVSCLIITFVPEFFGSHRNQNHFLDSHSYNINIWTDIAKEHGMKSNLLQFFHSKFCKSIACLAVAWEHYSVIARCTKLVTFLQLHVRWETTGYLCEMRDALNLLLDALKRSTKDLEPRNSQKALPLSHWLKPNIIRSASFTAFW